MKVIENYELFFGEKISKLILRYLKGFIILFLLAVLLPNGTSINFSIEIIFFAGEFSLIGKTVYKIFKNNMDNFDEYFQNYKGAYAVSLIVMIIFTLIYFSIKSILLRFKSDCSISIMDFVFELEWIFLLYAIMPISFSLSTYRKIFIFDIGLWTIFGIKDLYIKEVTVVLMSIIWLLIPFITYASTKIMFSSIKIRCGNRSGTDAVGMEEHPELLERMDKAYRIYTGKNLGHQINLYLIMNAVLFVICCLFYKTGNFTTNNASLQTAVIVASMGIFTAVKCESAELFQQKNSYLLTIKNRFKVYKDYYFTIYFSLLATLLVFIFLTYIAGGLHKVLPENYLMYLSSDIVTMLLLFGIVPFFMTSKSAGIIMSKIIVASIGFVPVKIFMTKLHWSIQLLVADGSIFLLIISNRYWLKQITKMYEEA